MDLDKVVKEYLAKAKIIRYSGNDGPWQSWGWGDAVIYVSNEKTPPADPQQEEVNEWGVVSP